MLNLKNENYFVAGHPEISGNMALLYSSLLRNNNATGMSRGVVI